jgi:hypothetical protein
MALQSGLLREPRAGDGHLPRPGASYRARTIGKQTPGAQGRATGCQQIVNAVRELIRMRVSAHARYWCLKCVVLSRALCRASGWLYIKQLHPNVTFTWMKGWSYSFSTLRTCNSRVKPHSEAMLELRIYASSVAPSTPKLIVRGCKWPIS